MIHIRGDCRSTLLTRRVRGDRHNKAVLSGAESGAGPRASGWSGRHYFSFAESAFAKGRVLNLLVLLTATVFEVWGDAFIRIGLRAGKPLWFLMGAALVICYGSLISLRRGPSTGRWASISPCFSSSRKS